MTTAYTNCTVRVSYDAFPENPTDWGAFQVVSFNRRHYNYKHPEDVGLDGLDEYGDARIACIGLRRKLATGTAFLLSYYEHGLCVWSLQGSGPSCRWDSADVAGVIYLDPDVWRGKSLAERENYARQVLKTYTDWCNGHVYVLTCEDASGDVIDSFGGVYGSDLETVAADEYPGARLDW